ncbi:aminotransferase class IV family protein [Nocardia sp. CC227C]|uniref:aminotransferase class IV family protein n=1 Tax=Nocardia sp. CC227C TaxID=3044562 RepID=UPI00278BCD06|nr:aminotransferase class IV family protein [Nocardia sp. CC227C]
MSTPSFLADTRPETTAFVLHHDGEATTGEQLANLAFAGHAHFTAMQVRGGRIRGLDLHLERLRGASMELFGTALPEQRVRSHLRTALAASAPDVSLMATVYSPEGEFTLARSGTEPSVVIRTAPPASGPQGPLSLMTFEHERYLPAVKHVGEVAKTHLLRRAAAAGFDDAAFLDRHGGFSEASIWNLAFWDGSAVVWPVAHKLTGTTMGIVRRQLAALGIPQRDEVVTPADLPDLRGAVVMNSWTPGILVHRIDTVDIPTTQPFLDALHTAYRTEPLTAP